MNNIVLKELYCTNNKLTYLDISNISSLQYLYCDYNQINSLNILNNIVLKELYCTNNKLTNLDISNTSSLQYLYCDYNQINSLNASNCISLHTLSSDTNQLNVLNLLSCLNLKQLYCRKNQLNHLDISPCSQLVNIFCKDNPNLSCIQVWDTTYANNMWTVGNGNIDNTMSFSLDCNNVSTAENLASSLSILPNPASDYLYISYEGEKKLSFTISDIWGKTLAAWGASSAGAFYQKEVSIADFPVGIYFLSAQAGDKKVVKKFVKE